MGLAGSGGSVELHGWAAIGQRRQAAVGEAMDSWKRSHAQQQQTSRRSPDADPEERVDGGGDDTVLSPVAVLQAQVEVLDVLKDSDGPTPPGESGGMNGRSAMDHQSS